MAPLLCHATTLNFALDKFTALAVSSKPPALLPTRFQGPAAATAPAAAAAPAFAYSYCTFCSVQAYDLPQEVGLISFGSEVSVCCEPTPLLEDFRDEVHTLVDHPRAFFGSRAKSLAVFVVTTVVLLLLLSGTIQLSVLHSLEGGNMG